MSAVNPQNNSLVLEVRLDVKLSVVPHPPDEISQTLVRGDVIVTARNWHRYHWSCLQGKRKQNWMTMIGAHHTQTHFLKLDSSKLLPRHSPLRSRIRTSYGQTPNQETRGSSQAHIKAKGSMQVVLLGSIGLILSIQTSETQASGHLT